MFNLHSIIVQTSDLKILRRPMAFTLLVQALTCGSTVKQQWMLDRIHSWVEGPEMVTAMETTQGLDFRLGDALGSRWAFHGGSSNTFKITYLFAAVWFSGFGRRKMIPVSNGAPTEKENSGWQNIVLENLVIYHQMPNMPMAHIHWYNCPTCLKYWAVVPISVKKCNQVVLWPSRLDLSVAFQSESIGQHLQSG